MHFNLVFIRWLELQQCKKYFAKNSERSKYIELSSPATVNLLLEFYVIGSSDCHIHLSPVDTQNNDVYHICEWFFFIFFGIFVCFCFLHGTITYRVELSVLVGLKSYHHMIKTTLIWLNGVDRVVIDKISRMKIIMIKHRCAAPSQS